MSDLKNELASLRLEEEPARSRRGVWIGLILIVVAAVSAFRRERAAARSAKFSWFDLVLKGTKVALSLWPVLRPSDSGPTK